MPSYQIENNGLSKQVVRTGSGFETIRIGESRVVDDVIALDEDDLAHYAARGVKVSEPKASEKKGSAAKAAAKALADAEKTVADGEAALAAAADDDAKAKAEADLKAAHDALAALKA